MIYNLHELALEVRDGEYVKNWKEVIREKTVDVCVKGGMDPHNSEMQEVVDVCVKHSH